MKKVIHVLVIIAGLFFWGCASTSSMVRNSISVTPGQAKEEVLSVMGTPKDRQFQGKDEAWQYCATDYSGFGADQYIVVWFYDGKVTGLTSYKNQMMGNCESFFKTIKWEEAPDRSIEFRNR
jgi:hypothetical protein